MRILQMRAAASLLAVTCVLALTACPPKPPRIDEAPPPSASCRNFQTVTPFPQTFPGPGFTLLGLAFTNPKNPGGAPTALSLVDRPEDLDGKPELNVGYSRDVGGYTPLFLNLSLPTFPNGVSEVWVELRHFASAEVRALDSVGAVVSTAVQPAQKVRVFLHLKGPGIHRVQFNTVETLVYQVCWVP